MRYVAAYLLAVIGGKEAPANADLEKILSSVGIEVDTERLSKVIKELDGKSIEDLIKEGREKLSSMPVGGGAVSAAPSAGTPAAPAGGDKKEASKDEKKEDSESEDDDMGFALFE
ncbi:60S acidic ribosomal protein P2 [Drosophila pseudoobscura]|uniref:Large ribosomal subunit protein P2 n=1 Tax=Drosophila pseudoobscura pseudoobscura TaxID=46245 RepID=A0A6I8W9E4_DROPS|nr:60S acidic ribosomal protein P2 [Drosophila pseudoobscura]XP_033239230.1 60S acidic ribosomal protein P2 [Drosophila pseudoobscura]